MQHKTSQTANNGKINEANRRLSRLDDIAVFLKDAQEAFGKTDIPGLIADIGPDWIGNIGDALGESWGAIRFVTALAKKATEITDPDQLAELAFSSAMKRSIALALSDVGAPGGEPKATEKDFHLLLTDKPAEGFDTFSFRHPLRHQFVSDLEKSFQLAARELGYDSKQEQLLLGQVRRRFPTQLQHILTDPKTAPKFAAVLSRFQLDSRAERIYMAWQDHFDYVSRLYDTTRVFGEESFTLKEIYLDTECVSMTWGDIRDPSNGSARKNADPLTNTSGQRRSLIDETLRYVLDSKSKDALVLQGPAGSGKSAFTLRLCYELRDMGFKPIRIRLRDVPQSIDNIIEAFPSAILLTEPDDDSYILYADTSEMFGNLEFLEERIEIEGKSVCPWVLILDGWDEVSLAANQGFAQRIDKMLNEVRDRFMGAGKSCKVILTGRPTDAVYSSSFLRRETLVLTIQSLTPEDLEKYLKELAPLLSPNRDRPFNFGLLGEVLADYKKAFAEDEAHSRWKSAKQTDSVMEILGLPLLAFLAMRLFVIWPDDSVAKITKNPTTLYRCLSDVVCETGARVDRDAPEPRIAGTKLRWLLRESAVAMATFGREYIPFDELEHRLTVLNEVEMEKMTLDATETHPMANLFINFFFKGGHRNLGAEFLHKSFREYLFAEAIVETLKEWARGAPAEWGGRSKFWSDFPTEAVLFDISRRLAYLLSPHWLSPEVRRFIDGLIEWEINRSINEYHEVTLVGKPTEKISYNDWERIRFAVADIWEWWGEGAHLRAQPRRRGKKSEPPCPPLSEDLAKWCLPYCDEDAEPVRSVTVDGHLGDGLFVLCEAVHHWMRVSDLASVKPTIFKEYSQYHYFVEGAGLRFKPGGLGFFENYFHRIGAAGWHPGGRFPDSSNMRSLALDLNGTSKFNNCDFSGSFIEFHEIPLQILHYCRAVDATFLGRTMPLWTGCNFEDCTFLELNFLGGFVQHCNISGSGSIVEITAHWSRVPCDVDPAVCPTSIQCSEIKGLTYRKLDGALNSNNRTFD